MEAHRLWLERFHAGDREIEVTVLEPDNGLEPIPQRLVCTGSEELELDGRLAEVSVWEVTLSLGQVDLKALRKATRDGTTVYEEISAPMLGRFVTRLATRAEALAAGAPPEIMVRAFVRPDRPLRRAAELRRLGLRLRVAEGAMPSLPSAGAQVVQAGDDPAAATLWIDVDRRSTAPAAEASDPSYLASSSMIAADDELVRELAAEAVRGADGGAASRAEAMRRFVQGHMSGRGLDTAFATASESARTRKGDCSEHAVLLCAMLRSQGIPARVAIGLVYAEEFMEREGIFGWHMWTQALLEGRWVDLDATFPGPYHAAHVLTAVTALPEGGLAAELATTLLLLGNLRIEVLDVPHE
jgi:transglutaminase-like putative cysteine protease